MATFDGKGIDTQEERKVCVCFLQITGVVATATGKEGGCSERRGTSLCCALRLDQQELQVPFFPLGFVRVSQEPRGLSQELVLGDIHAPLPTTNAYLVLRTIDFHTREGMWGSKQIILSKKIFFLQKSYMK